MWAFVGVCTCGQVLESHGAVDVWADVHFCVCKISCMLTGLHVHACLCLEMLNQEVIRQEVDFYYVVLGS